LTAILFLIYRVFDLLVETADLAIGFNA